MVESYSPHTPEGRLLWARHFYESIIQKLLAAHEAYHETGKSGLERKLEELKEHIKILIADISADSYYTIALKKFATHFVNKVENFSQSDLCSLINTSAIIKLSKPILDFITDVENSPDKNYVFSTVDNYIQQVERVIPALIATPAGGKMNGTTPSTTSRIPHFGGIDGYSNNIQVEYAPGAFEYFRHPAQQSGKPNNSNNNIRASASLRRPVVQPRPAKLAPAPGPAPAPPPTPIAAPQEPPPKALQESTAQNSPSQFVGPAPQNIQKPADPQTQTLWITAGMKWDAKTFPAFNDANTNDILYAFSKSGRLKTKIEFPTKELKLQFPNIQNLGTSLTDLSASAAAPITIDLTKVQKIAEELDPRKNIQWNKENFLSSLEHNIKIISEPTSCAESKAISQQALQMLAKNALNDKKRPWFQTDATNAVRALANGNFDDVAHLIKKLNTQPAQVGALGSLRASRPPAHVQIGEALIKAFNR